MIERDKTRVKMRAIVLAFLMVTSVVGATMMFSGTAAAANNLTVTVTPATNNAVGDTVTAEIDNVDPGNSVTFEHVYNGEVVNETTKTNTGGSLTSLTAEFSAAKSGEIQALQGGSVIESDTYTVDNYQVNVLTDVLHGTTSDVRGEIVAYDGTEKILANDTNIDYELYDTGGTSIASGDTDNGEFLITRTFDNEPGDDLDYPSDANSDGEPSYEVYVQEDPSDTNPGAGPTDNDGSDIVNVRLDVTASTDSGVEFGDTSDVTGSILDGNGDGVPNYKFAVRDTESDPADDSGIVKERSSTTANNGAFGFTMVFNDAGPWAYGTDVGGDSASPNQDDDFVQYGTFTVETAQAGVSITGDVGNQQSFQSGYTVEVTDQDGNSLDLSGSGNYDGYVAITGEFEVNSPGTYADDDDVIETVPASDLKDFNVNTGDFVRAADLDDDGQVDQIHLETDSAGQLDFDVTPLSSTVGAELQSGFEVIDDEIDTLFNGVEETSINTPETPDLAGSDSTTIGAADQVNIRNYDIEDPQTDSDFSTSTNIFDDDGPSQVAVLPLAVTATDRLQSDETTTFRTGSDTNQDLDGLTTYRVQFEAFDENNDRMIPSGNSAGPNEVANVEQLRITGAGVNGTIDAQSGSGGGVAVAPNSTNVIDADYHTTSTGEYTIIVRPTEVSSLNEQFEVTVIDSDDNTATESRQAVGLQVTEFEVDGETVEEVTAGENITVTSVVQNEDDEFVNNGRVRLSQTGTTLDADVDARTAATNINGGAYEFTNVEVGPRGIDSDTDGIGESISQLTFTAYQYNDADSNSQVDLEEDEVTRATVETLDLTINDNLEITYLNASNEYAGNTSDGTFTVTQGVEYNNIAFRLTDDDGPVDLTAGIDGVDVALNDLATEELVTMETSNGGTVDVTFDEAASNPSEGYYIIDDLEQADAGEADLDGDGTPADIDTIEDGTDDSSKFVFDSGGLQGTNTTYTLSIETPTRDQRTNTSVTGTLNAAPPMIETTVVGVAGENVPNSDVSAGEFNTNTTGIETLTIDDNRDYRINGTVMDALGTPLNGSQDDEVVVQFVGDESSGVDFTMIDTPGSDEPTNLIDELEFATSSSPPYLYEIELNGDSDVEVENENGTFAYEIRVTEDATDGPFFTDETGTYEPPFIVGKQDDFDDVGDDDREENTGTGGGRDTYPGEAEGFISAGEAKRPVVEVYDRSGAELPVEDENSVLAQNVENRLRVEVFPADQDDFVLSNDQPFGFDDPKAEDTAGTTTTLSDDVVTPGYDEGQLGFIRVTPTGTGTAILGLTDKISGTGGDIVVDQNGSDVEFDVLSSNLQVDVELSSSSVEAGENVTVTLAQQSTGEPLPENTRVSLVDPDGTQATSALTNASGQVTLGVSANASTSGTFTVETRPAGFEPASVDLAVEAAGQQFALSNAQATVDEDGGEVTLSYDVQGTNEIGTFYKIFPANPPEYQSDPGFFSGPLETGLPGTVERTVPLSGPVDSGTNGASLMPGERYVFEAYVNNTGGGFDTTLARFTTPSGPLAVELSGSAVNSSAVTLTSNVTGFNGTDTVNAFYAYRVDGQSGAQFSGGPNWDLPNQNKDTTITGLQANTTYAFTITVNNGAGDSVKETVKITTDS
jgi:surface glycoprotein (TIGR04207 family)